jgi:hypothetical protein
VAYAWEQTLGESSHETSLHLTLYSVIDREEILQPLGLQLEWQVSEAVSVI